MKAYQSKLALQLFANEKDGRGILKAVKDKRDITLNNIKFKLKQI